MRPVGFNSIRACRSDKRCAQAASHENAIQLWAPLTSSKYAGYEKFALIANVFVALAGLGYALMLVGQVKNAPQGTQRMQEIAQAIREGANAYLYDSSAWSRC